LLAFLLMGGFVAIFNYAGFHLAAPPFLLSSTVLGLLFMVYCTGIVGANWAGRLVQRFGAGRVLRAGICIMLAGMLLCALPWLATVALGLACIALGFFAAHSVASGLVGKYASSAKAQASALYLCAYYLGSSVVGYVGGYVWGHAGWIPLLLVLGAVFGFALWSARRL
jgi:YNFM family putative membrane transporter